MVERRKLADIALGVRSLRMQFWGSHPWAQGYLAISSGNIMDEMIQQYIQEQEGGRWLMAVDFKSPPLKPLFLDEGCSVQLCGNAKYDKFRWKND